MTSPDIKLGRKPLVDLSPMWLRRLTAVAVFAGGFWNAFRPESASAKDTGFLAGVNVYQDNGNGVFDEGDYPLPNFGVQLFHNGQLESAGFTDFFGKALFSIPWDGRSKLDGQGFVLSFSQQSNAPACEFTGRTDDYVDLKDDQGKIIGRVWNVGWRCDDDVLPNPPNPIVHNVTVCEDTGGDGSCDPDDPPLSVREVSVFDGADVIAAFLMLLPADQFHPIDSGITNAHGQTTVTTETGNVVFDDPFDTCDVKQTVVTRSPGSRDVSLAVTGDCLAPSKEGASAFLGLGNP